MSEVEARDPCLFVYPGSCKLSKAKSKLQAKLSEVQSDLAKA